MSRAERIPIDHSPDTPLRMDIAAKIAFPDGSMGAAGLRKERDRGRLVTEMIAGKEYTTLADIERMRELCRVQPRVPASSGVTKAGKQTAGSAIRRDGSSETDQRSLAQAAAMATANALSKNLANTSAKNTSRKKSADVIPMRS